MYSFSSNLLSLLISTITILIVPKFIGVVEYGYWQLYLLYVSYTGLMQLGWCDGVYLRYGGKEYEKLNKKLISSQFWYIMVFYILFSLILLLPMYFFKAYLNLQMIFWALISGFITTPRGIPYYILQATNNIKQYAKITMIDRGAFCIILITLLVIGCKDYHFIIVSDIAGKLCAFVVTTYFCRDIIFSKITTFKESIIEACKNLNAGFKLMVANIASQLILGIVRLNIESYWGIEVFGKVSLTLSISNLFMVFINAVAIIMFPMLRKISDERLPNLYRNIRTILMLPILFVLVFYYPLREILILWLPQYAEGLRYMALLIPIIVYESKMSLLVNTYLKSLRKEKQMLIINLLTVVISLIISNITVYWMNNLDLTIIAIVVILAFRSILAEIYISSVLKIEVLKDIVLELIMSFLFILSSWFIGGWQGVGVYFITYLIYFFIKKNDVKETLLILKSLK